MHFVNLLSFGDLRSLQAFFPVIQITKSRKMNHNDESHIGLANYTYLDVNGKRFTI